MLSVIIPTRDRVQVLRKTIKSLMSASEGIDLEIIIVNDSKTNTPEIDLSGKDLKMINNPKTGVASARNLGASIARNDLLLFLDDDILINKQNLTAILNNLNADPKNCYIPDWTYPPELIATISNTKFGRYLIRNDLTSLKGWAKFENWDEKKIFEIKSGASYCLPISRKNFELVKGYDENFPYAGAEDHDFCTRLLKAGIKFYIDPTHTVFHNEEDRKELKNWLERKKRDSETKKIAAQAGYSEFRIVYSPVKKILLKTIFLIKGFFFFFLNCLPNQNSADKFYGRIVNILCAAYIYEGYNKK